MAYTANQPKKTSANVLNSCVFVAWDVYGCILLCVCVCFWSLVAGDHSGIIQDALEFQVFRCVCRNVCLT